MSFKARQRLASLLTFIAFRIFGIRRRLIVSSICEHLDMSSAEAEKLAEKTCFSFLLNAFAMAGLKFMSDEQLHNSIKTEGLHHLENALAEGKGAIIISGHFGLWELVPPWLASTGHPITVVVRRQNNPYVDRWFEQMRRRHGAHTTDSGFGIREILRSLRQGHILALMIDQDNGKQGIFVRFFKKWASAPTGPAQIALKTGAPIVPLAIFPDYADRHRLVIFPPIRPQDFSDDTAGQQKLTAEYTGIMEEVIRSQPHNWFWLHRRWKTQPEDAPGNPWAELIKSALTTPGKAG